MRKKLIDFFFEIWKAAAAKHFVIAETFAVEIEFTFKARWYSLFDASFRIQIIYWRQLEFAFTTLLSFRLDFIKLDPLILSKLIGARTTHKFSLERRHAFKRSSTKPVVSIITNVTLNELLLVRISLSWAFYTFTLFIWEIIWKDALLLLMSLAIDGGFTFLGIESRTFFFMYYLRNWIVSNSFREHMKRRDMRCSKLCPGPFFWSYWGISFDCRRIVWVLGLLIFMHFNYITWIFINFHNAHHY